MFKGKHYVYAVYKERSFSKAAKKLFISQPALSATIKKIEEKIGSPLFYRHTNPLTLTECGKKYMETLEKITLAEQEFLAYLKNWETLQSGKITIGGTSLFTSIILPPLIANFSQKFPGIQINLVEETTAQLTKLLGEGSIDLVLDNSTMEDQLFSRSTYGEDYILLAVPKTFEINEKLKKYQLTREQVKNKAFLAESMPTVPLAKFEHLPFILLKPNNDTREKSIKICQKANFKPTVLFEVDQQLSAYTITASGLGISFIGSLLVSNFPVSTEIIYYKLDPELSSRLVYFYWRKHRYMDHATKAFLQEEACQVEF